MNILVRLTKVDNQTVTSDYFILDSSHASKIQDVIDTEMSLTKICALDDTQIIQEINNCGGQKIQVNDLDTVTPLDKVPNTGFKDDGILDVLVFPDYGNVTKDYYTACFELSRAMVDYTTFGMPADNMYKILHMFNNRINPSNPRATIQPTPFDINNPEIYVIPESKTCVKEFETVYRCFNTEADMNVYRYLYACGNICYNIHYFNTFCETIFCGTGVEIGEEKTLAELIELSSTHNIHMSTEEYFLGIDII